MKIASKIKLLKKIIFNHLLSSTCEFNENVKRGNKI